jgi:hypothetical protein
LYLGLNASIIESNGMLKFDILINELNHNESLKFVIDNILVKKYKLSGHFREVFKLNKTNYNFNWIYKRRNTTKINNSIEIQWIYIENTNTGISTNCIECEAVIFDDARVL